MTIRALEIGGRAVEASSIVGRMVAGIAPALVALAALAGAPEGDREPAVTLNLDLSRPSLVDPEAPWGWYLAPLEWVGVEPSVVRRDGDAGKALRLVRPTEGPPGTGTYFLDGSLRGGGVFHFTARVRRATESEGRVRLGLSFSTGDEDEAGAWSEADASAPEVTLEVAPGAESIRLHVEYSGRGEVTVSDMRLEVDGEALSGALPGQQPPSDAEVGWVAGRAIPLRSTDPSAPLDDLAPLRPLIGDSAFVLLGEATHGTREFFTLKHRLVRWLVEEEGFSVVVLEDHVNPARAIDRYVQTGEGDPAALVRDLFGVWEREETVELVRWMRGAAASGRRLGFWGMDCQVPLGAMEDLQEFAATHDPDLVERLDEDWGPMRQAWTQERYPRRDAEEHRQWSRAARRVLDLVEERSPGYSERVGRDRADWALFNARLVWQSALCSEATDIWVRDRFMAENLGWIREREGPDARLVVWAHNSHVQLTAGHLGDHLRRLHPGEVVSVGFTTQQGEYAAYDPVAREMRSFSLHPGPVGSVEYLLHRTGWPLLALDLRPSRSGQGPERLRRPNLNRNIGLYPADLGFRTSVAAEDFDLLVFVDRTEATRPIPSAGTPE